MGAMFHLLRGTTLFSWKFKRARRDIVLRNMNKHIKLITAFPDLLDNFKSPIKTTYHEMEKVVSASNLLKNSLQSEEVPYFEVLMGRFFKQTAMVIRNH